MTFLSENTLQQSGAQKLKRFLQNNSYANTYLFASSDYLLLDQLALLFANDLLLSNTPTARAKLEAGNHPDIFHFYPEGKKALHKMDGMLSIVKNAQSSPFEGVYKVFIIHHADRMLPSSSNALLKVLEEPHEKTIFLLLSTQKEKILPTILSRSFEVDFAPLSTDEMKSYMEANFEEDKNIPELLHKAHGSLSKLEYLIEDPTKSTLLELLLASASGDLILKYKKLAQLDEYYTENTNELSYHIYLDYLFEEIGFFYRDLYLLKMGIERDQLYFKENYEQLQSLSLQSNHYLEKVMDIIGFSKETVDYNIRLSVILDQVLSNLF